MTYWDNVALNSVPTPSSVLENYSTGFLDYIKKSITTGTSQAEYLSEDWLAVGKAKREMLGQTCPGMQQTQKYVANFVEAVQAKSTEFNSHFDF